MRGLTFAGRLASRNPRAFGGSLAFAIAFSFVAANAMWYQPGVHPSPFMRTRLPPGDPQSARLGADDDSLAPRKVTTFVIQREDEAGEETASIEQRKPETQTETVSEVIRSAPEDAHGTDAALVSGIQKELARRGLYDGPADGKTGPKTSAAILRFEKQAGRAETGTPSDGLAPPPCRPPRRPLAARSRHAPKRLPRPSRRNGPTKMSRPARGTSIPLPQRSAMRRSIRNISPRPIFPPPASW